MASTYETGFSLSCPVNDIHDAQRFLSSDDMTEQLSDELRDVVILIRWKLTSEVEGMVRVVASRDLTGPERNELTSFIANQNEGGLGERFEQQPFARWGVDGVASFDWKTNSYFLRAEGADQAGEQTPLFTLPQPGENWLIETARYGAQFCSVGLHPSFEALGLMFLFTKPDGQLEGLEIGSSAVTNPRRVPPPLRGGQKCSNRRDDVHGDGMRCIRTSEHKAGHCIWTSDQLKAEVSDV
ncbi:hypothetical protein EDF62_1556 [Leucobacter luti]|uniref:Uncharacterized protein n=1 Tax=Leucobacter luti TaxID=340320 RepID=A0A4R6RZ00_9MICO|nr:hypothetical protein [Leucobacter luti]TDP92350.1 hypothetical protein EDF62_1556 [Leucobacter luti]